MATASTQTMPSNGAMNAMVTKVPARRAAASPREPILQPRRSLRGQRLQQGRMLRDKLKKNGVAVSGKKKMKAVATSGSILAFAVAPFYLAQAGFALVSILGMGAEYGLDGIVGSIISTAIPGTTLMAIGIAATWVLGFFALAAGVALYSSRRINWFKGSAGVWFFACLILYAIPVLNLVPWVTAWMYAVVKNQ